MATDYNTIISQATSQRSKKEQVEDLVQLVVFELDNEEYAVPIEDLQEIIKIPEISPVPNSPDCIEGILNLRGTIVVVIDLEKKFGLVHESEKSNSHIIITKIKDSTFGIIVEKVSEVLRVPVSKIQPAPSLVSSKIQADFIKGVAVLEEEIDHEKEATKENKKSRLIIILDLPTMLSDNELSRIGSLGGAGVGVSMQDAPKKTRIKTSKPIAN